jgi:RimJ/RimL family protein N-acetyltransferase
MPLTARLSLEPLDHEHAEGLVAALADEAVGRYIGGPAVTTVEALHERIDRLHAGPGPDWPDERWWNFVVRRLDDGRIIGRVEGTTYGDWGEVAYLFDPVVWGHGYATEATKWLMGCLRSLGAGELWAAVLPPNTRSIALLARLGFEPAPTPPSRPLGSYDDGDLVFVSYAAG